jgi:predicted DNA-binding transcriptional regulator AlpA
MRLRTAAAPASRLAAPVPAPSLPDPAAAFVRLPVVCALFSISPATAWRWVKKSVLPTPRRLSEAVTAWNVGELRKALNGEGLQ